MNTSPRDLLAAQRALVISAGHHCECPAGLLHAARPGPSCQNDKNRENTNKKVCWRPLAERALVISAGIVFIVILAYSVLLVQMRRAEVFTNRLPVAQAATAAPAAAEAYCNA